VPSQRQTVCCRHLDVKPVDDFHSKFAEWLRKESTIRQVVLPARQWIIHLFGMLQIYRAVLSVDKTKINHGSLIILHKINLIFNKFFICMFTNNVVLRNGTYYTFSNKNCYKVEWKNWTNALINMRTEKHTQIILFVGGLLTAVILTLIWFHFLGNTWYNKVSQKTSVTTN
jgi:hypothetical protein